MRLYHRLIYKPDVLTLAAYPADIERVARRERALVSEEEDVRPFAFGYFANGIENLLYPVGSGGFHQYSKVGNAYLVEPRRSSIDRGYRAGRFRSRFFVMVVFEHLRLATGTFCCVFSFFFGGGSCFPIREKRAEGPAYHLNQRPSVTA
jgi:hypothetical protein